MRIIAPLMQELLEKDGLEALANFWTITFKDGSALSFTDWDSDVGVFKSAPGWSRSAVQQRVDLASPNQEITGIVLDGIVSEGDIRAGKFDGASAQHWLAVPTDANFLTYGKIFLPAAYVGEIKVLDGVYVIELRGVAYKLTQSFIEVFTPTCKATFADKHTENRCKLDPAVFTSTGTVVGAADHSLFSVNMLTTGAQPFALNSMGLLTWDTGLNAGFEVEVATADTANQTFKIYIGMPYAIQPGDAFHVVSGCAKTLETCKKVYNNTINFRGTPFIPGMNFLMDYGTTTT